MTKKYDELLKEAREAGANWHYQRVLKAIVADGALEDQDFIKKVLDESIPTILTNDQKKSMKALAKQLISDKAALKIVEEQIKNAPNA